MHHTTKSFDASLYPVHLAWSQEDEEYVATTPAFPLLSVLDPSPQSAVVEFYNVLAEALASIIEDGGTPPDPDEAATYSGQTRLRMPVELHGALSRAAEANGVSLNTYLVTRLAYALGREGADL